MGEEFFGNDGISKNDARPCSYIIITLSDLNGIQVKASMSDCVSKKVVGHLMASKQAVIDSIKGAIIKDLLSKNMREYLNGCVDELQEAVEIPYVSPLNTYGGG